MIKFENVQVYGFEQAIRGMRNPLNSWEKSDSIKTPCNGNCDNCDKEIPECDDERVDYLIGPNDHDLMLRLARAGTEHSKYRRMIVVYADITAPLFYFKQLETYKVGTVCNSCSTMHKIHAKEFVVDDFSMDGTSTEMRLHMYEWIEHLNRARAAYLETKNPTYWRDMICMLPENYNQRRTYMLNYEVISAIYRQRKGHKLTEWEDFRQWIKSLPYSELITLEE